MKASIHSYSDGRLVLRLTVEHEAEQSIVDFLFGNKTDITTKICRPNPSDFLIESEKKVKP